MCDFSIYFQLITNCPPPGPGATGKLRDPCRVRRGPSPHRLSAGAEGTNPLPRRRREETAEGAFLMFFPQPVP